MEEEMNKEKGASKGFILSSYGLKYKLKIILLLVTVLPFLICAYLVSNYVMPYTALTIDMAAAVFLSAFIALTGFFIVKQVFDRVLSLSEEAESIASRDLNIPLGSIKREDEVAFLSESFSQLTQRLRSDMEELKRYSQKTSEINLEIQKHMAILSNLLQISHLISEGAQLDEVMKIVTARSQMLGDSETAYLLLRKENVGDFYIKEAEGLNTEQLMRQEIKQAEGIFTICFKQNKPFILDSNNPLKPNIAASFYENFRLKNTVALPVYLKGKVAAILGMGNNLESFSYKNEDIKFLDIFVKQLSMALENDMLARRLKELEVQDALTGLYNATFIRLRLSEEIKRAIIYRRPCSFILINIDNFQQFHKDFGLLQAEIALKRIASLIRDSFTEVDRVARIGDNEFAVVLPEKNKRQAYQLAEEVRKKVDVTFNKEAEEERRITVSGGVSENPLDGVSAEELIDKAKGALSLAKTQGKNRINGILP